MELTLPAAKAQSRSHWTARDVSIKIVFIGKMKLEENARLVQRKKGVWIKKITCEVYLVIFQMSIVQFFQISCGFENFIIA